MTNIRIMVSRHSAFYTPLISTIAARFLSQESLQATYSVKPAGQSIHELIGRGEVDVVQAAVSTNWGLMEKGQSTPALHFSQINQRDGFFLLGRKADPGFQWKKLEGASLLADHAQQPLAMLRYAADLKGVRWDRIDRINAGGIEETDSAFRAGQGQYIHQQGPAAQQLEKEGVGSIVASVGEVIPLVAFSSLAASREWLATESARAFVRAYRKALRWVNETPAQEIARREAEFFPEIHLDVLATTIARYQELATWNPDPTITRKRYEQALDVFLHSHVISRRHPYEEVVASTSESDS